MLKYEETFQVSKGCKLATVVVQILLVFFFYTFLTLLAQKYDLHTPTFYIKTNHFTIITNEANWQYFSSQVPVFPTGQLFLKYRARPVFQTMPY